jgi:hypothetical protein
MPLSKPLAAIVTAATFALAPVAAVPALAQETSAPAAVSDAELDAFVIAYREVFALEQQFGAELQQAEDEATQQAIIAEAQAEMTQAVEDAPGIGVERYIEILQLAQADPELQAELTERLQN